MANSNATSEWESFAQSARLALQRLKQAQMALAFLGDDERANHVSMQLHDVAEMVGTMQSGYSALVFEHGELQELMDGNTTGGPLHGLMVEPIGGKEQAHHGWNRRLGIAWLRFKGLAPVVVAICVIIAAATGMMGHGPGASGPTVAASGSGAAFVGDTISAGGVSCTLLSVTVDTVARGNSHHPPEREYLTAHIQLHNTGTSYAHYDSSDFPVQTGTGNTMSETVAIISSFGSGELAPGGSIGGDLVFNVPRGNGAVELTWSPLLGAHMHEYAWLLEL